jgi:hypothetical protein
MSKIIKWWYSLIPKLQQFQRRKFQTVPPPRIILPIELEQIFYCGSFEISADSEAQGLRKDLNGRSIRRDYYNDRHSDYGWGVVARHKNGKQVLVPMRLREIDLVLSAGGPLQRFASEEGCGSAPVRVVGSSVAGYEGAIVGSESLSEWSSVPQNHAAF